MSWPAVIGDSSVCITGNFSVIIPLPVCKFRICVIPIHHHDYRARYSQRGKVSSTCCHFIIILLLFFFLPLDFNLTSPHLLLFSLFCPPTPLLHCPTCTHCFVPFLNPLCCCHNALRGLILYMTFLSFELVGVVLAGLDDNPP